MHIQIIVTAIIRYFTCITQDTIKRHKQKEENKKKEKIISTIKKGNIGEMNTV